MGASVHQEPIERGPGFLTASVVDPFGNGPPIRELGDGCGTVRV
jgi:hypothetical protein